MGYRPEIWDRRRKAAGRQQKRQEKDESDNVLTWQFTNGLYRGVNWLMADQNRGFL